MELFKDSINEVVLKDAHKKSSNCFSVIDVLYSSFKKGAIDEEYLSNKVKETNQKNFVYGYINGVKDAINNEYSKEALYPSSKENTKLVNEKDFAFAFTFTDNDGTSRPIVITGKRTKFRRTDLISFNVIGTFGCEGFVDNDARKNQYTNEPPDCKAFR